MSLTSSINFRPKMKSLAHNLELPPELSPENNDISNNNTGPCIGIPQCYRCHQDETISVRNIRVVGYSRQYHAKVISFRKSLCHTLSGLPIPATKVPCLYLSGVSRSGKLWLGEVEQFELGIRNI